MQNLFAPTVLGGWPGRAWCEYRCIFIFLFFSFPTRATPSGQPLGFCVIFGPYSSWLNTCLMFCAFGAISQVLLIIFTFVLHYPSQANALVSCAPLRLPPRPCPPREVAVDTIMRPFALNFQEPTVFALNVYFSLIDTSRTSRSFLPFRLSRYLLLARPTPRPVLRWPLCRRIHRHSLSSLRTCITSRSLSVTQKELPQARGAHVRHHRRRFSRPHLSVMVRMDAPLERLPDCTNHGSKSLRRRRAPPFHNSPFLSYSLQSHREFVPNERTLF